MKKETPDTTSSFTLSGKLRDYMMLIKFSLSFMVVFSAVISFLLAPRNHYNLKMIVLLFIGGLMVTGSANACIAAQLAQSGTLPGHDGRYVASQGRELGRDGKVHVRVDAEGDAWIGGQVQCVIDGRVDWPARSGSVR